MLETPWLTFHSGIKKNKLRKKLQNDYIFNTSFRRLFRGWLEKLVICQIQSAIPKYEIDLLSIQLVQYALITIFSIGAYIPHLPSLNYLTAMPTNAGEFCTRSDVVVPRLRGGTSKEQLLPSAPSTTRNGVPGNGIISTPESGTLARSLATAEWQRRAAPSELDWHTFFHVASSFIKGGLSPTTNNSRCGQFAQITARWGKFLPVA